MLITLEPVFARSPQGLVNPERILTWNGLAQGVIELTEDSALIALSHVDSKVVGPTVYQLEQWLLCKVQQEQVLDIFPDNLAPEWNPHKPTSDRSVDLRNLLHGKGASANPLQTLSSLSCEAFFNSAIPALNNWLGPDNQPQLTNADFRYVAGVACYSGPTPGTGSEYLPPLQGPSRRVYRAKRPLLGPQIQWVYVEHPRPDGWNRVHSFWAYDRLLPEGDKTYSYKRKSAAWDLDEFVESAQQQFSSTLEGQPVPALYAHADCHSSSNKPALWSGLHVKIRDRAAYISAPNDGSPPPGQDPCNPDF